MVIGAGFAGLSAASFLARDGYKVQVLEKNPGPGGRCRVWELNGFRFDMGPSWYWMPDVFERYFQSFGKSVTDYYQLKRLDPSYRVFFKGHDVWDIPAGAKEVGSFLEQFESGADQKLQRFLKEAAYKYEVGINRLVYKPGRKIRELLDPKLLSGVLKLDVFNSMSQHIRSLFKDERIIQLLEFPVLFLGAKPQQTPALYSLMNYADIQLGTWYPEKGMFQIVEAMHELALELGVEFHFNEEVLSVETSGRNASAVNTKNRSFNADAVVGAADYQHLDQKVLNEKQRSYSERYWNKRVMAPSSIIFYLGLNTKIDGLLHHNLFFDTDFVHHASQIYDTAEWPDDPLFYVSMTSATDHQVAPTGSENLFILVPVAPGLQDTDEIKEKYYHMVMSRLEKRLGRTLREHVVVKRAYAQSNFIADYHSFKGNAYGLANTLLQTAHLKPSLKSKRVNNLYYSGQLTVPGPGVPPSLISGEVVANEIKKEIPA